MLAKQRALAVARALEHWDETSAPLYIALADALGAALRTRRIAPHLPSERALATALHLGRGTVANAYDVLREQGVLERERGSGSVATVPPHLSCSDPLECVRAFFADPGDAVIADR